MLSVFIISLICLCYSINEIIGRQEKIKVMANFFGILAVISISFVIFLLKGEEVLFK